jgi:hypothetical protein
METRMQRRWKDPKYREWHHQWEAANKERRTMDHHEAYIRRRNAMTPEQLSEYRGAQARRMREYRKLNPEQFKGYDLRKCYGIGIEEFEQLLAEQGNLCALCQRPLNLSLRKSVHVDHCHNSKKVRGILHRNCNVLVGMCEENAALLELAKEYLAKHA